MKLLIDIGNTRIKWATAVDGVLAEPGEAVHKGPDRVNALEFTGQISTKPEQVLAANVAGDALSKAVVDAVRARWDLPVDFAFTQPLAGSVRNAYDDYRQMGVDRWLAILAACERYSQAVCIVDAGTAVTIDQVDATGAHLGGAIVPGLDLMRRSLATDTGDIERLAQMDDNAFATERSIFGRNTADAIRGGAMSAICSLIEYSVQELSSRYGESVLVMTGGDARWIMPQLRVDLDHRPLLVLEGLAVYAP